MNSPVTSAIGLSAYRRAVVACFVFRREISRKADFFDSIGQNSEVGLL
jgi:diphthamide biosynthesis methyltransferase